MEAEHLFVNVADKVQRLNTLTGAMMQRLRGAKAVEQCLGKSILAKGPLLNYAAPITSGEPYARGRSPRNSPYLLRRRDAFCGS